MRKIVELTVVSQQGVRTFKTRGPDKNCDEIQEVVLGLIFQTFEGGVPKSEIRECPVIIDYDMEV